MPGLDAPILDLGYLGAQAFGDRALERDLLDLFEEQCRRLLPAIEGHSPLMTQGDAAHTLKGAALAVGAGRVAALAATIEGAIEHGTIESRLSGLARELEVAIEEVIAAIACRRAAA
jgi:HPt (histidine-containing phosphotransfer) domain-containing protein